MFRPIPTVLVALALTTACKQADPADPAPDVKLVDKIGAMVVVGFRGMTLTDDMPIATQLEAGQVGGIVLFDYDVQNKTYDRNIESPEQVAALNAALKAKADFPLLVSVDEEGGRVTRLKDDYGFPDTQSAQALGEGDPTATRAAASAIGATLAANGFNLDLAPVVDVNVNPDSPAIGGVERSFSDDPAQVVAHAEAFVEGLDEHGIRSTLKHFPGHGSATADSHLGVTDVTDTWSESELIPYRTMIEDGQVDLVMTAHVYNETLDPDWPATLSEDVLGGILRDELGWDGVVISDDLQMGAIRREYAFETVVERAILAGNDLLVFSNNSGATYDDEIGPKVVAAVQQLVKDGVITKARIDQSYARILALRERLVE